MTKFFKWLSHFLFESEFEYIDGYDWVMDTLNKGEPIEVIERRIKDEQRLGIIDSWHSGMKHALEDWKTPSKR